MREWAEKGVPPGFGKELYPGDIDRLSPHLGKAPKISFMIVLFFFIKGL